MSRCTHGRNAWFALAFALLAGAPAAAAPPVTPQQMTYQGVLLDDLGQPRTGSVDLTLRVYDALVGGILIYKQTFFGVPLTDGVFSVPLGPTGSPTDTPANPLTTSLSAALGGDVGATGPQRFLETTVGTDGALARTQILTVPYALRADSAASADTAALATTALDAQNVNGLDATVMTEIFEHFNFDAGPPNDDPSEGLGDTDGDGAANFVDPDNDDDGISDADEVAQGSNINLVTPMVSGFAPASAPGTATTTVTVNGANFEPGLTVVFGSETPTPTNLTSTSFDVQVGPQLSGSKTVHATISNGETGTGSFPFFPPTISGLLPASAASFATTTVTVSGTDFVPGLSVAFGIQNPTPTNVTSGSFDVQVGPQPSGAKPVEVSFPNGDVVTSSFTFTQTQVDNPVALNPVTQMTLDLFGSGQVIVGGMQQYAVDTDGDMDPELLVPFPTEKANGQLAVAWGPAGAAAGLRCRSTGGGACSVELVRDQDADFQLEDGEATQIELAANPGQVWSPSLAFDPSGRPVAGYVLRRFQGTATVAHDRDGDGLFSGTNERVAIESFTGAGAKNLGQVDVDGSGRAAYAYFRDDSFDDANDAVRVAYDRNGDGDFADTVSGNPELATVAAVTGVVCVGATFDPAGRLAVIYGTSASAPLVARDLNGDGDFADAGETTAIAAAPAAACAISGGTGQNLVAVHNAAGLRMLVDANNDGDFADLNEDVSIDPAGGSFQHLALRVRNGLAFVATDDAILLEGAGGF